MLKEFEIIKKNFQKGSASIFLGIGDDAALFEKNKDSYWAISQDTLNIDTHFLSNTNPENLGWKSLAVNVSDILAMGGHPKYALLSLSMPSANELWVKKFSRGFFKCAKNYGVELIGGDTTHGSLSISICILGEVLKSNVLLRANAKVGDDIWVTGELGLAALGLKYKKRKFDVPKALINKAIISLEKIKALDIVAIDITASNALFDQIIVASAESTRQARAFVNNLKEILKGTEYNVLSVEGETSGEWVLIDLGDLIVHIMKPEVRTYYNLEDLWKETPSSEKGDRQQAS